MVHVRRGDRFLVVFRTGDAYWHVIAGGVEGDETWEEAARRELREETALDAAALRAIGTFTYIVDERQANDVRAFATDAPAGWEPTLNEEHEEYRWCTLDEAEALLRWPEPKELLRAV
jgi:dATP pyrophosphohydrolase